MKDLLNRPALLVIVALVVAFAIVSWASSDNENGSADDNQSTEQTAEENGQSSEEQADGEQSEEQQAGSASGAYSYTAQSGDNYTKIARKAVQTYGINNGVSLSSAEIVAAETFLTSEAGFPALNEGQALELSGDAVKAAVEKAQGQDAAAKARWEKYVPSVDFNTDNVGQ